MRAMLLAAGLVLSACAQEAAAPQAAQTEPPALEPVTLPQADGAGNRLEALTQNGARWCSADSAWCVEAPEGAPVRVIAGAQTIALPMPGTVWPYVVRVGADSAMVGVIETTSQMYSGGGGSAQHVTLFQVSDGRGAKVVTLPVSGNIDIRACFDEDDTRQRADACSDQYSFVSRVRLDESVTSGEPRIVLETAAGTFPGRVSRNADSLARPPLTQADLVWATDDVCSFRRTFSRSSAGPYVPDAELPACTDYLEP